MFDSLFLSILPLFLNVLPIGLIGYCILNLKKKSYFWNMLISIGLLPFYFLIFMTIYSFFNGSGLTGETGGVTAGLFAFVIMLIYFWGVYIGAILLLIFAFTKRNKSLKEKKEISIIEKSLMISIIVTNIIYLINYFSVDIINKPLIIYRFYNNTYYSIGVIAEKISENGMYYYTDIISLIIFFIVLFSISLIFLKNRKTSLNNNDDNSNDNN